MTLEEKNKLLSEYNAADYYNKGSYIDAQDTTNNFIMAKVTEVLNNEVQVNFDGWSNKWDHVSIEDDGIQSDFGVFHRNPSRLNIGQFSLINCFFI